MAQQVQTWDGQSWLLDPGALFLDFIYTGDFGVGRWREGIILTAQGLDAWLAEHVAANLQPTTVNELEQALMLRACLSRLVKAAAGMKQNLDERDISFALQVASRPDLPPMFPGHEPEALLTTQQALSTIARDSIVHLRDHRDRLRNCCGEHCPMVFLDLSRSGKRAWCSMARCGNRAKVRAFRARTAERKKEQTKD